MDHERFLSIVQREADVDRATAERAARATLETLARRVTPGEVEDIAEQAPPEVARWLGPQGTQERFGADEFVRRVAGQEGVDPDTAGRHVRAVLVALSRAVTGDELDDLVSQLPKDYGPLLEGARRQLPMPYEEFLGRVVDRTGLNPEGARRACDAVLETLAERIAGGEVRDLMEELPAELHPALEAGKRHSHGRAQGMTLPEFLERVAEREGVPVDEARVHAKAVLSTVRDAVVRKEFRDLSAELPRSYIRELAVP